MLLLIHLSELTSLDVSYLTPFSDARAARAILRPRLIRQKWREAAHGGFDFGKLGHFAPAVSGICARGKARLKALLKQAFPAKARTR